MKGKRHVNVWHGGVIVLAALCIPSRICAETRWQIDPAHSSVRFRIPFMLMSTVHGTFGDIIGTMTTNDQRPDDIRIDATIGAASLDTRNPERDADLRGPACLDVTKYPYVTFRSTAARRVSSGEALVAGNLTIRDVTHPVEFVVEGPAPAPGRWRDESRVRARAIATVNWRDYGLKFNRFVGDKLFLVLHVELIRS